MWPPGLGLNLLALWLWLCWALAAATADAGRTASTASGAASSVPVRPIPRDLLRQLHPASVVAPQPASSGLWLALLSGGSRKLCTQYAYHLSSKPCYVTHRGYSFLLDFTTSLPTVAGLFLREHWRKVLMLQRWLPYFHYIFWMDLDTTIFDVSVRLESFLIQYPGAELLVPQDTDQRRLFSNDVFLLRAGAWGRRFLDRWWAARLVCPGLHGEQGAMHATLVDFANSSNASQTPSRCRHLCRLRATRLRFYACIEDGLRQLPPTGPVAFVQVNFTTGEGGLCLNGHNFDHRGYPALQRRLPFCLHAKQPRDWAGPAVRQAVDWALYRCPPLTCHATANQSAQ
eukprot:EG_transcript_15728